ncbi:hypothetical protein GGS23DRAFT_612019 [Durotheca rogersii]|uniref:uncharacterized protein n=1 Tax=Durotheca rogersii TaxID=419775 RepID=UPI002220685A|nr:uncharacterized protein GGS23DRAFT_612019 [Durotheca rogersii]KAI5861469.1 hypothetical protein GGS23DRAFT_612019 [Durotheca rogersii]
MSLDLNNRTLRTSSSKELVEYFRQSLRSVGWKPISDHIYASIDSGAIPPIVVHVFLCVCKEPGAIVESLCQNVSAVGRHVAINHFGKLIRTEFFPDMWKSVGGTPGMLALMSAMSVYEVRLLCQCIGGSSTATHHGRQRQECMSELFEALHNTSGGNPNVPVNPDPRPLGSLYDAIAPACTSDIVTKLTCVYEKGRARRNTWLAHVGAYQEELVAAVFCGEGTPKRITGYKFVLEASDVTFALGLLERLSAAPDALRENAENLAQDLAIPLARRLRNRRANSSLQIRFYSLLIGCIGVEPRIGKTIPDNILYYAIRAWRRASQGKRDGLEKPLSTLISLVAENGKWSLTEVASVLRGVQPAQRFSLLQLLLQNVPLLGFTIDLSDTRGEKIKSWDGVWPLTLFDILPSAISHLLLEYLRKIYAHSHFIEYPRHMFNRENAGLVRLYAPSCDGLTNLRIVSAQLNSRLHAGDSHDATCFVEIEKALQEQERKAVSEPIARERSERAATAVLLSMASGSLSLYEDTMTWARRFDRDANAVYRIYSRDVMCSKININLLSAIPYHVGIQGLLHEQLRADVQRANQIIMNYMETAATCLREPYWSWKYMIGLSDLPSGVIWKRVERLTALQDRITLSDEEIFLSVWEPTIDMLLEIESFGLREAHKSLGLNTLSGPLKKGYPEALFLDKVPRHVHKFLDNLAQSRDKLWREYRVKVYPMTARLQAPWPNGLPIQWLTPLILKDMPYTKSRVEAIVFARGNVLLAPPPTESAMIEAIGPFVDDYGFALRQFVLAAEEGTQREEKVLKAWNHVTGELTGSRMSPREGLYFWKDVYDEIDVTLPKSVISLFEIEHPHLPSTDEGIGSPTVWNPTLAYVPLSEMPETDTSGEFSAYSLDHMLDTYGLHGIVTADLPFRQYTPRTRDTEYLPSIWEFYRSSSGLHPHVRDAVAAAAIAFLETKYVLESGTFVKPFPSLYDARFPAVRLDDQFLQRENSANMSSVLSTLERFSSTIPTRLLGNLAKSLLKCLDSERMGDGPTFRPVISCIRSISRGDQPSVACEFVKQVILAYQDESSWHRHICNAKFLSSLPAHDAKAFVSDLFSEIHDRLRKQNDATSTGQEEETGSTAPHIRVTIVKMVTQILCQGKYLDQAFACEALAALLKTATHPDIRTAIVENLTSLKSVTNDDKLKSSIIDLIEEHAVPIAASINERHPPTEEDWLKAESGDGPMPRIDKNSCFPPILGLLVGAIPDLKDRSEAAVRSKEIWMKRIIIPILEQSSINHRRWTTLFLNLGGFTLPVESLPLVPVHPKLLLDIFLDHAEFLPEAAFRAIRELSMINIRAPKDIDAINKAARRGIINDAGSHWISVWNGVDATSFGVAQSVSLLLSEKMNSHPHPLGSVTIAGLQEFLVDVADAYISAADTAGFDRFLSLFDHPYRGASLSAQLSGFVRSNYLPLLERFIARIGSLRNQEWLRDPNRQPPKLPATLPLKLKLFKGRYQTVPLELFGESVQDFVSDITSLLEELVGTKRPYHQTWPSVKETALGSCYRMYRIPVALELGSLERRPQPEFSLVDYLRIELAGELMLQALGLKGEGYGEKLRDMVESWSNCHDEIVRMQYESFMEGIKTADKTEQREWLKKIIG